MGQKHKTKSHQSRTRISKLEKMRSKANAPRDSHRVTLKETGDMIYEEHKKPCGYAREFFVNDDHTRIYSNCVLNNKPCPYHSFNIKSEECDVYQRWLKNYIARGYKE